MAAALGDAARFFVVAYERGHVVPAAHERVEHGRADVAGRAGEKDSHELRSLLRDAGFHHNSAVVRDTLIDFFHDLVARARRVPRLRRRVQEPQLHVCRRGARGARLRRAPPRAGLRKGDKVVFWSENRPEWIVAFWGCLLGGVIVVPIDYRASPDFLARVGRIVAAKLVLIGQDVPPIRTAIDAPLWKLHELEWRDGPPPAETITRDDIAEIIFTSGATAEPKGVVITHRNVLANIVPVEREVLKYRKWGRPFFPLRFLNLLPLSHMFGQAMATFIPPMLPGVVIFMRGYNPVEIVAQIKKRRISVLVSVPKILDVLREHVLRVAPVGGRRRRLQPGDRNARRQALVALPPHPPAVRPEVLGVRRRRRAARRRARGVLVGARLRRDSGLRPHGDRAHRHASITRSGPRRDRSAKRSPASR